MRILHIGKYFPPDRGGMESFLADLVAAQRAQGLEVAALVHGEPRGDDPDWLVRVPVAFSLVYAPWAPGFRRALARLISRFEPDLLHLHLPNNSAFWALTLQSARCLPWVVHWHSDVLVSTGRRALALAYRFYRPFEQAVLKRAERVIATSPDYLAASEPLARWSEKCLSVPLGLGAPSVPAPVAGAAALPWPPGTFRLLSLGRLAHYKGFETLIRAVADQDGVHLVIAGGGELHAALARLVAACTPPGRSPRVTLSGPVDEAHKHALLAGCDAFCLASCERTEAFGIAAMEAMQYGKPCLVSALHGSGLPWLVRSARAGRTVPVGDVPAWRSAIEALRSDPATARRWGEAGRRAVAARFGIAACSARIQSVYRHIRPGPPSAPLPPLIVIPARNEAATVGQVIAALRSRGWDRIVVVDDQSTDETAALARAAGAVVISPVLPMGAWGAMQTGIRYALEHGYQQVVTLDADGQHEPACIPALLEAGRHHPVVIGAHPQRGSRARRIAWRYFRLITGFAIQDLTSGFRCYNRAACEVLADEEATLLDYQDLGVLMLLRHAGLHIVEVPVDMYPRLGGPSRIFASWPKVARYMIESTLLCLARWHPKHLLGR
ncbi:glycosyltransferase [Thauera aromatica]|nr:glycosyltransferase [Thauera aromatica]MCK2127074.1 glycosyltransferase [Thauera aromatica]